MVEADILDQTTTAIAGGTVYASLTRIADLAEKPYSLEPLPRAEWQTGDYVVGEVQHAPSAPWRVETVTGRMVEVIAGNLIVGALGSRYATLECAGDWREVGEELEFESLTRAGVFGKCTSISMQARPLLIPLRYCGHVTRDGRRCSMEDFVLDVPERPLSVPIVLIVGTSMEAGKTTAAKAIIRALKALGLTVAGAKVTGVGRYRDILLMKDAGADFVVDFVDAGLPSTICPEDDFRAALRIILSSVAQSGVDVLVAEAGASPLEPYNGAAAIDELADRVRFTVLCASDPYAVIGVMSAFGATPDLVSGRAASTEAGVELIKKLSGLPAMSLIRAGHYPELAALLKRKLEI